MKLPLSYRLLLVGGAVPFTFWNLSLIGEDVRERKAAGETVTYGDIRRHPRTKSAAWGIGMSTWYATGGFFGADLTLAKAFTTRVPVSTLGVHVAAGAAGGILGAAVGIGISQALWGQSGRDTAIEFYTGKVSLSEWWGAVSKIPSLR